MGGGETKKTLHKSAEDLLSCVKQTVNFITALP